MKLIDGYLSGLRYLRWMYFSSKGLGTIYEMGTSKYEAAIRLIEGFGTEEDKEIVDNAFEHELSFTKDRNRGIKMRIIIAGSRSFKDYKLLNQTMNKLTEKLEKVVILVGGAEGADALGERWASDKLRPDPHKYASPKKVRANMKKYNQKIGHYEVYRADWTKNGKAAGPIRNSKMVKSAKALVAFWDGKSPGTKDVIQKAKKAGLSVRVIRFDPNKQTTLRIKFS